MTSTYFTREIESHNGETLEIYQATIGDVGHVVWDAAIALCKFFDTKYFASNFSLAGKRIIELGAGTGVVGLAAALHGAHATITDLPALMELMQKNIDHNASVLKASATAKCLAWGTDVSDVDTPDMILFADCIYYEESLEPLVKTLRDLSTPETVILMSFEERTSEKKIHLQNCFFKLIDACFVIEEIPMKYHDDVYRSEDIHILKFTKKK